MKYAALILSLVAAPMAMASGIEISGSSSTPVEITPESSSGLDRIYVIENAAGVTLSYRAASSSTTVEWETFSNLGGAYATPISVNRSGALTSYTLSADDCGFIIREGDRPHYYWIVNYANHQMDLQGMEVGSESDCSTTQLNIVGSGGDAIAYYTINGVRCELSRELQLSYKTLEYDSSKTSYQQVDYTTTVDHLQSSIHTTAPLCDTNFTLSGDRFLSAWGKPQQAVSSWYNTVAVAVTATATQTQRENDNEQSVTVTSLGGSAPVEIVFSAEVTDAAKFTQWQFSQSEDFDVVDLRYNQTEVTYTFNEYGTTYVRFVAADDSGDCEAYSETFTVEVGESQLLCPNAFSPGNQDGINDIWKVSYKSIVDFECYIFNRWGVKMATLTDPSQGWDGRYGGKIVNSGVYYYVIKARGSDGKKYNLSGDINIINYKQSSTSTSAGSSDE